MKSRVVLDTSDFEAHIGRLKNPGVVVARAMNRSIDSGRTAGTRLVAADMRLKVRTVREFVRTTPATAARLVATVYASARRVPVMDFNARGPEPSRGRGRGVKANTRAERYPRAFIASVGKGGHRGVFERKGLARLPIKELYGPSVWQSFQNFVTEVRQRVVEQAHKNIADGIRFALSRKG